MFKYRRRDFSSSKVCGNAVPAFGTRPADVVPGGREPGRHKLGSGQGCHGAALRWQRESRGGTRCPGMAASGGTGHWQALPRHPAALPGGMGLLPVQNLFADEAVAIFLPLNFGLLRLLPSRVPPVPPAPHSAGSTAPALPVPGPLLLASAGDTIGCLPTELEITVIILCSNWQDVW